MLGRIKKLFGPNAPPLPPIAGHIEYSAIMSADDDVAASEELIKLALKAAGNARSFSMKPIIARMATPMSYPDVWPGEHYKLLASLVQELAPQTVIEIGTFTGLSALAILQTLSPGASLYTFDIIPWNHIPETCLRKEDFADGRLKQLIGDVSNPEVMRQHRDLFARADLIFIDGPKDGVFEQKLLDLLSGLKLDKRPVLLFDDIRLWNMLAIWRGIRKPKLDLTSFGHWSGTGLMYWD